jgi:hypothetical protein
MTDIVSAWRQAHSVSTPESAPGEQRNYPLVGATFAAFAVYVFLLPFIGFRIATFLFVAAVQIILQHPLGWRRWVVVLVAALATVIATYFAFEVYLSVLLPRGRWTGF